MPTVDHNKLKTFPVRVPRVGVAGYGKLFPILSFLLRLAGFKLSLDGVNGQEIDGGLHLEADNNTDEDNFQGLITSDATGIVLFSVAPGTVGGSYPTLGGTSINQPAGSRPTLPLYVGGTIAKVYLHRQLTIGTANGFLYSWTRVSDVIETAASVPANSWTSTTADVYRELFTAVSGGITRPQPVRTSLEFDIQDNGLGAATGQVFWPRA